MDETMLLPATSPPGIDNTGDWEADSRAANEWMMINGWEATRVTPPMDETTRVLPASSSPAIDNTADRVDDGWADAEWIAAGWEAAMVAPAMDETTQDSPVVNPPAIDKNIRLQVERYAEWLAAQARHREREEYPYGTGVTREMNDYAESAAKTALVGKRKVQIFAPFRAKHSALQTFTPRQIIVLSVMMLAWVWDLLVFRQGTLIATLSAIMLMYLSHLLLHIVLALNTFGRTLEEEIDEQAIHALHDAEWPPYTILCPLYKEAKVVPQFVQAMSALSYPTEKLQILLLTEQDDVETRAAIRALRLPPHFQIVTVPEGSPRTKPRACNYGLIQATGQYVVIYDAEDIPEPLQLKKAVLTFANHGSNLACVQAKLNFYNPEQNLLTRWFTAEYSLWFDLILPGLQRAGLSIPLGGTSNHFPIQMLRALGAWDAFNVTEDCDLGLRLVRYRFDTVILNSVTHEEANSQMKNWIRQRSRWIKGYMQTYLVHMRESLRYLRPGHLHEFVSLQLVIGSKAAVLFLNPLLWSLFVLYFVLRPDVGQVYHELFPKPLLYIGTLSLIFGNFFYIYVYLLACMRRKQYHLIKWTLFIPIYWLMMSVAACMALFQLVLKPHYWEKTEHGLHLRKNRPPLDMASLDANRWAVSDVETTRIPALNGIWHEKKWQGDREGHSYITSVTMALRKVMTLPMPALSQMERLALNAQKRASGIDPWLFVILLIACNMSIAACSYAFTHNDIMLYSDAYAHLRIALRVIDANFSLAQLGGVWLPLPHILILPFIWNNYLWRTGLAGSIPSMVCYIITTIFLFLSARRLTKDHLASFVGTLVFVLNPNILYLQTTPLSELVCIATLTMACYFFLAWAQEDHGKYLVLAAGSTLLATLARYDGWLLFALLPLFILIIGRIKRQRYTQIEGNLIVFCALSGLGIALWLVWCATIFGDPLYFQHSAFSSQAQQSLFLQAQTQYAYQNILQSFRYYTLDSMDVVGPILFGLAALAMVIFIIQRRLAPEMIGAIAFLAPFVFYVISLYTGQAIVYVPEAVPANAQQHLFNARFGAEMVVPVALFIAILVSRLRIPSLGRLWGSIGHVAILIVIIVQMVLVVSNGIITLQDGEHGVSCAEQHQINVYLAQHYNGGKILEDIYSSGIDGADAGVDYQNFVNESSGKLWTASLQNPAAKVDWIILRPESLRRPDDPHDLVAQSIALTSPAFLSQFSLVVQEPTGLELFHRNGLPPLPTHPIPAALPSEHSLCGASGS